MIYTIENELLTVSISSLGAELMSIKSQDTEYLWQGDSKYWNGRAPIMFPTCGRLFEGKYTYLGKEYSMPNHGIARSSEFTPYEMGSDFITLELKANDYTRSMYPFEFLFRVTFKLKENKLSISYFVKNLDNADLIFGVGGHPAFNVPLEAGLDFSDYIVEFPTKCDALRVDFSPACFLTNNDKLFTQGGTKAIELSHNMFDNDAIFLYNIPKSAKLYSPKGKKSVTISYGKMKYLGLWHMPKTDAPYICLEPWSSVPATEGIIDNLLTKQEMMHLPSGYTYKNDYTITLE
ncbi:MAG: aldose 1-epimerase family protein [Clostridia bacterium]|nr:aldose 1-epimerase family protein [Clostridia bacterium]